MGEYKFYQWMRLEQNKERIIRASEGDGDFPNALLLYLSEALGVSSKWYEQADWLQVVLLFYICISKSPKVELPMITPSGDTPKKDDWDYPGRTWYVYTHMLANQYGWKLDYISNLSVRDALSYIQEIMTNEQLEKEFQYSLSEVAYPYDKQTKKSTFKPLPRPHWMRPRMKPVPTFKIPKSIMPVGLIIADNVLPPEFMPREIQH